MSADGGHRPLTAQQQKAAALIGRGVDKTATAADVGVSRRTITDWCKREDFAELANGHREAVLDEHPTARATLEAALTATTAGGAPDWKVRVSAARALVAVDGPGRPPEEPETEFFDEHIDPDPRTAV